MARRPPASIRNKNPGAFWGRSKGGKLNPLAQKWGATGYEMLNDGLGQGNNIATFATFEDGCAATLDLWRSSSFYKNKKFKDAIRTWCGNNGTESYIKIMLKNVPGLTRDTVLNDDFWRSPSAIPFLKTQATHEAGQRYPATDTDWINAQRRVMGVTAPAPAEVTAHNVNSQPPDHAGVDDSSEEAAVINVQPQTADYSVEVEIIQRNLDSIGYHEVGDIDGRWGGKTVSAIAAFFNDRGVKALPELGKTLNDELAKAKEENWTRPISEDRATATPKDVAEKSEAVRMTLAQRFYAKIATWAAGLGLGGTTLSNTFGAVQERAGPVREFFKAVPPEVWFCLLLAVAGGVWYATNRAAKAAARDYNVGRLN